MPVLHMCNLTEGLQIYRTQVPKTMVGHTGGKLNSFLRPLALDDDDDVSEAPETALCLTPTPHVAPSLLKDTGSV